MILIQPQETCTEDFAGRPCGKPVTDEVSWVDKSRAEYPPVTPENPYRTFVIDGDGRMRSTAEYPHEVVRRVCASCADDLMGWRAGWLSPRRAPIN